MPAITDERLRAALASAPDATHVAASAVRSLEGISEAAALSSLVLEGAELGDLGPLGELPKLERLALRYSKLPDLGVLSACRALRHLEVSFCSSDDLAAIGSIPQLETADLVGSPWSDDADHAHLRALRARLRRAWASMEREWSVADQLRQAGTGLTFGLRFGRWLLVRPGLAKRPGAACDFVANARIDLVRESLRRSASKPTTVLAQVRALVGEPALSHPTEGAPLDEGTAADALRWLDEAASRLPGGVLAALRRWVQGFPLLRWGRSTEAGLSATQAALEVVLPAWFAEQERALATVEPGAVSWVRLSGGPATVADQFFSLGVIFEAWSSHGPALRKLGLLPIALERATTPVLLAVPAVGNGSEPVVIVPRPGEPSESIERLQVAFPNFAALVDSIAEVALEDESSFVRISG